MLITVALRNCTMKIFEGATKDARTVKSVVVDPTEMRAETWPNVHPSLPFSSIALTSFDCQS